MHPRLQLLHELLSESGTIAIHLDNEELAYAIVILDEIFGRSNRIGMATFKQSSVSGPKAVNPGIVSISSYVFFYAKNKSAWKSFKAFRGRERDSRYSKFIENLKAHHSEWRVISLNQALEEHFGDPVQELKRKFNIHYERRVTQFVIDNREAVIRTARVKPKDISEDARPALQQSEETADTFFEAKRDGKASQFFWNGEQVAFYSSKVQNIDGNLRTVERVSDLWDDLLSNNLHKEGGVSFPKGKKPEALVRRVLQLFSKKGDLVLDSFLGSGTTAAVAHKMERRYIGIEMGDHAVSHCQPRLKRVVKGDKSGISRAAEWRGGGGFRFFRLGRSVFDEKGQIRDDIQFDTLAAHVWFSEFGAPWDLKGRKGPVLGVKGSTALALLYNGILRDRSVHGGNVLTRATLRIIRDDLPDGFDGILLVYGERCILSDTTLERERIIFKQTPYDVKVRA